MPATSWTELSASAPAWQEGLPTIQTGPDYFVDWFFEGGLVDQIMPPNWSELSVSASSYSEMSVAAPTWSELTL